MTTMIPSSSRCGYNVRKRARLDHFVELKIFLRREIANLVRGVTTIDAIVRKLCRYVEQQRKQAKRESIDSFIRSMGHKWKRQKS